MVWPKKKGGLGMWSVVSTVRAINSIWGFNLETNRLSKDQKDLHNYFVSKEYSYQLITHTPLPGEWAIQHMGSLTQGYLLDMQLN
jgi:hypothetical protein